MNKKTTTEKFIEISKIDSPSGQEKKMVEFMKAWLKHIGFDYTVDEMGNILANNFNFCPPLSSKDSGYESIMFCAHLDTVQPGEGIVSFVEEGWIKSKGNTIAGVDNKASVAAIMDAIETYVYLTLKGKKEQQKPIELLFTCEEETGKNVEFIKKLNFKSRKCIVLDSSNPIGGIVLRSTYCENFYVELTGLAGHVSKIDATKNALVPALEAIKKLPVGMVDEKTTTTMNIGTMQVGPGVNTIPDKVLIGGEVRSYSQEMFKKIMAKIKKAFLNEAKKYYVKINYKTKGFCPGYEHHEDDKFVKETKVVLEKASLDVYYLTKSGVSDANTLNEMGIKTLNLTNGGMHPHTTNEKILVEDLEKLSEIILNVIQS